MQLGLLATNQIGGFNATHTVGSVGGPGGKGL